MRPLGGQADWPLLTIRISAVRAGGMWRHLPALTARLTGLLYSATRQPLSSTSPCIASTSPSRRSSSSWPAGQEVVVVEAEEEGGEVVMEAMEEAAEVVVVLGEEEVVVVMVAAMARPSQRPRGEGVSSGCLPPGGAAA